MLLVISMAVVIWGAGMITGAPARLRWAMLLVLWVSVVIVNILLPSGHSLREATGNEASLWLLLGGGVALILLYRTWLGRMRMRARPAGAKSEGSLSGGELERYARHIVLREIGGAGQKSLKKASVLVIGAGGLGSSAILYLAASGVGRIGVIDDDRVENSNLQRQVIHADNRIGMLKADSARDAVRDLNPYVEFDSHRARLDLDNAAGIFKKYDVILDGTDNFETRYLSNKIAHALGKPLVSGALSQWEGQLSVFETARKTPCYQCVFPRAPGPGLAPGCAEAGVLSPLPGVVGSMMAVEAVKVITGAGSVLRGEMLIYDALYGESRKIALNRREDCPVCGNAGISFAK